MNKETKSQVQFYARVELFDHVIYPISVKIDDNNIIQLFRKLHIMSSIDYKISLDDWIEQSTKNLQGFTEREAVILFNTYKAFASEFEQTTVTTGKSEGKTQKNNVDVRYFGVFFALQLFMVRNKVSIAIDTRDKTPWQGNSSQSPMSSPRGKSFRNSIISSEYQITLNFIKSNIKLFLRLIASDIHNTEASLNANEFNTLKLLFKPNDKKQTLNLSNYAPFFNNFSSTTKINVDIVTEWLSNIIPTNYNEYEDLVSLKYLQKCVTIKDKSVTNKHIKIINCEDSYIYINTNVQTFRMQNCINCTVFVAAVSKISSIDKCENCHICVATNFLRVSNSIDSYVYSYVTQEPVLFGDNRGLILAPHNVGYNDFTQYLKFAKIHLSTVYINNWSKPIIMNKEEKEMYEIMQPKDFMRMVVPFNQENAGLNLSPKEYYDAIKEREETMNTIKSMIKEAKLQEEQEKALHVAIQGYFRDWLVSSGNIKQITELVKMIDLTNPNSDY